MHSRHRWPIPGPCVLPALDRCLPPGHFGQALGRGGGSERSDRMKTTIIGGVAALAMCGTSLGAFAADLPPRMAAPVYAPAMAPAPVFSWTGFYIGTHIGWG